MPIVVRVVVTRSMHLALLGTLLAACGAVKPQSPDAGQGGPGGDAGGISDACSTTTSIDQQLGGCQSPPITQCAPAFILHNGQSAAQGFVPAVDGVLARVRVRMSNGAAGISEVELALVEGTGPDSLTNPDFDVVGHTRASARSAMTVAMAWQTVMFDPAPAVIAGRTYFLIARLVGADPGSAMALWDMYNDYQGNQVDSYPAGRAFSCGTGCAGWIEEPTYRDFAFETQVTIPSCGM